MNLPLSRALIRASLAAALCLANIGHAEETRVKFPQDLATLVHYATVKRGNVTEHISTTREAIDAVRAGKPVPDGTHFVLADYRDDKIYRYFVMQKGSGWGQEYDAKRRTGDWQFQWFWPDKRINTGENTARCQSCHQSQREQDYLYTGQRIGRFNGQPIE